MKLTLFLFWFGLLLYVEIHILLFILMRRANKKRFNQGNDDLHSSFRYAVLLRNHSEPVWYCRILEVCGTQDGGWIGDGVGGSAALLDSVCRAWGKLKL